MTTIKKLTYLIVGGVSYIIKIPLHLLFGWSGIHKDINILTDERSYLSLDTNELLNIYMDLVKLILHSDRLAITELQKLHYLIHTFRIWCLDLCDFENKYHCGTKLQYHIALFELQYKDRIDINHSLEYVELNALNVVNQINELQAVII